jgi:hypothetical protein
MKKEKTEPVSKEPTTKERSNRRSPKTGGEFNAPLLTQHPSRQTACGRPSRGNPRAYQSLEKIIHASGKLI